MLGASCSRDSQTPPTEKASKIFGVKITYDDKQNIMEMTKAFPIGSSEDDALKKLNDIAKSRDDCTVTVFNHPDGSSAVDFIIETHTPASESTNPAFSTMFIFSKEKQLMEIFPRAGIMMIKPDFGPPPPIKNKDVVEAPPKEKAFKIFGVKPTTKDYLQNYNEMTKAFPIGSSEDDVLKRLNDIVKARSDCRIRVDHLDDEMSSNDAGAMIITFDIVSMKTFQRGYDEILSLSFYFTTEKKLFDIVAGRIVSEAVGNESTETKLK